MDPQPFQPCRGDGGAPDALTEAGHSQHSALGSGEGPLRAVSGKVVLEGTLDDVRASFGKNTLHIDFDGDGAFLRDLPQVRKASVLANTAELSLAEGADAQQILQSCIPRLRIRKFEVAAPSLEEIFIAKVGAETLAAEVVR